MNKMAGKIFGFLFLAFMGMGFYSLIDSSRKVEEDKIVILTRNAPTTVYQDQDSYAGFEYDMVRDFVTHTGVKVDFVQKNTVAEILRAMREGEGDIAAAGLTKTANRVMEFDFALSYYIVSENVVCNKNKIYPKSLDNLKTELVVMKDSSYEEKLKNIKPNYPNLKYRTVSNISTEELLRWVYNGTIECTVADSNIVAINKRYYPNLKVIFSLPQTSELAWILNEDNLELQQQVETWFAEFQSSGRLQAIIDRYYSFRKEFVYIDALKFKKDIQERLNIYKNDFKDAEELYKIPWKLLASIAYEESAWKKDAIHSSGVRGIMMLSKKLAKKIGVKNRLNATESIFKVAKYLSKIAKKLPKEINKRDKIYFTLVAYHIGYLHLSDAMILAKKQKLNPNSWQDMKKILPLLSQKKYYQSLKYGYSRGDGAINFTTNVINYYKILKKQE